MTAREVEDRDRAPGRIDPEAVTARDAVGEVLVDQGTADTFLVNQLKPELLQAACSKAGIKLTLNMRERYDHSYFFIASFIEDHLRWHAARLR